MPQQNTAQESIIASLYIQAINQGQSLWFRVSSSSMNPTIRVDDNVRIEPAKANEILPGEIVAFETPQGLVIHRIIGSQHRGTTIRLLQMADVELHASWIEEPTVIGRVVTIRRGALQIDLQHPIAHLCATVIGPLRHQLFRWRVCRPLGKVLHRCSRLAVLISYWCIRSYCSSPLSDSATQDGDF